MWQPTHVKVAVNQARNLLVKGKSGTNDAFVVIGIGKEKFHTSIKTKATKTVEWREECELEIPSQGNKASIQLTVYHHNSLGIDEFLGQVAVPLSDFDVYEKPKYKFYKLKGKPDKDRKKGEKERGELEVLVQFIVKSGNFLEANKKEKTKSSTSLKSLGGSLMSFGGNKDKHGLKDFARSVSSKMDKIAKRKKSKSKSEKIPNELMESSQYYGDADPGVISDEDDDFRFDDDIKVFTNTGSPHSTVSRGSSYVHEIGFDDDVASHTSHESSQVLGTSLLSYDTPNILGDVNDQHSFDKDRISSQIQAGTKDKNPDYNNRTTKIEDDNASFVHYRDNPLSNTLKSESSVVFNLSESIQDDFDNKVPFETIIEENSDIKPKAVDNLKEKLEQFNLESHQVTSKSVEEEQFIPLQSHVSDTLVDKKVYKKKSKKSASSKEKKFSTGNPYQKNVELNMNDSSLCETPTDKSLHTIDAVSVSKSTNDREQPKIDSVLNINKMYLGDNAPTQRKGSISTVQPDIVPILRTNSLKEKNYTSDEWGKKLFGVNALTGSHDDVSLNGSKSNLNSRASSTQDVHMDDFSRQRKVKALTLSGKITAEDVENFEVRKTKRKAISAFKNKIFHKSSGKLTEEDYRFVEGGNDRVPAPPTRTSRLSQEIHDKFAGKSREDLLEMIMSLQGVVDKQVRRTDDLECYLDNLLLRVMESTPNILRTVTPTKEIKTFKIY